MSDGPLFPRDQYLDGDFPADDLAYLDSALAKYHRNDPKGLADSLGRMCGCKPLEYYEAMANIGLKAVELFGRALKQKAGLTHAELVPKVQALMGTVLAAWAQRKVSKSILEDIQ